MKGEKPPVPIRGMNPDEEVVSDEEEEGAGEGPTITDLLPRTDIG